MPILIQQNNVKQQLLGLKHYLQIQHFKISVNFTKVIILKLCIDIVFTGSNITFTRSKN